MKNSSASQQGFSLIELLIVVAIIGIIASIAILYTASAKRAANSASAISSLRIIHQSEGSYRTSTGHYGDMTQLRDSGYINDPNLRTGQKSRYQFTATPDVADDTLNYAAEAVPMDMPAVSHYFFVNATGVIRSNVGAKATDLSPALN